MSLDKITKYIIILFLTTRILLTVIGLNSQTLLTNKFKTGQEPLQKFSTQEWIDIWGKWDSNWYLDIAKHGYSATKHSGGMIDGQANYAFFPIYPGLINLLNKILPGDYFIAGLIISNFCLLVSAWLLFQLTKMESDEPTAERAVKYLFLFPTAFLFSSVLSESLFLFLSLLCLFLAKKQKWGWASLAGLIGTLTRPVGIFLIILLLFEYFKSKNWNWKKTTLDILFFLLLPLGIGWFMLFNYYLTGDYLAFAHVQANWDRHLINPFWEAIKSIAIPSLTIKYLGISAVLSIFLLIYYYKLLPIHLWVYSLVILLVPMFSGLHSTPRLLLVIFPFYIILAKISKNKITDEILTITFIIIQTFFMIAWSLGTTLII